jgi:hypothetical protein
MTTLPADNAPSLKTDTRAFKAVAPGAASIPSLQTGPRAQVPIPTAAEYINARQFCDRLGGISFTTLARMTKRDPDFPRAIYFANRIRFFKVSDILAYEHLCEIRTAAKLAAKVAAEDATD